MSQHHFSSTLPNGKSVSVLTGWDRPLQQYFLVIMADDPKSQQADDEGIVYSNLYDVGAPTLDLEYFLNTLLAKGIAAPEGLAQALQRDRDSNVGNVVKDWNGDGNQ